MAKPSKLFTQLVGWGLVFLIVVLFAGFAYALKQANPSVAAAVIGGVAAAIVGIGGALLTQVQTKRREIEEAHRPKKVEIYQQLLELIARLMSKNVPHASIKPPTEKELVNFMLMYKAKIILWGSPDVIRAHLAFESASKTGANTLLAVDKLYQAIRSDLGLSNAGLSDHQLIRLYLKDPAELDQVLKGEAEESPALPIANHHIRDQKSHDE